MSYYEVTFHGLDGTDTQVEKTITNGINLAAGEGQRFTAYMQGPDGVIRNVKIAEKVADP